MFNQKILVLGNETADTDVLTLDLAVSLNSINHGLISSVDADVTKTGCYHTTITDMVPGDIVTISNKFNTVIMLDQSKESYPHWKAHLITVRLMHELELLGVNVEYRNNDSVQTTLYWQQYLKENKSFCFHPFIALISDTTSTNICPKNLLPITELEKLTDWKNDPNYIEIRNDMVAGTPIPNRCSDCYDREKEGQESTRQYETLEWAERLSFKSVDDFINATAPSYYEIRPSNMCNIMCRTCDDGHSHLIEREWKTIGIPLVDWKFNNTPYHMIDLDSAKRIYWGGGEPTIMPEFYSFLQKCVDAGRTDFELEIGTNGMKYSNKLLDLLDNFSNVNFALSFDGYQKVNDYIRWKSDFDTVVKNGRMLQARGHKISVQTVFSMYSITRIHEIFEFYDREFPQCGALINVAAGQDDIFMPFNHPCPELVVESMRKCKETKIYYMIGRSVKSQVDLMLDYYSNPCYTVNIEKLKQFYEFNDKLDQARNSLLGDYIPELEQARKLYF
jgi:sulfatase maturation enzyme AslB (radical SAM superfamily)